MSIDTPPPAAKPKSTVKWLVFGMTCILIVLLLTNPNQTAHFTAIQEARKARFPAALPEAYIMLSMTLEYHNYGIFSTVTGASGTWSLGYLGRVQTTDDIKGF